MAIGVAKAMKSKLGEALDLEIYTNDSEEAKRYNIMASTTVFINEEWCPLDIATSQEKLGEFLKKIFKKGALYYGKNEPANKRNF